VLQERKIRAVGDTQSHDINVRIIAATHKDLRALIGEGRFREDLYFRLAVIPIHIPSLRERREDIPLLAEHFLKKAAATNHMTVTGFTPAALDSLVHHRWEGNVRELENIIERAVVLSTGSQIDAKDLPFSGPGEETPEAFFTEASQHFPTLQDLERRYVHLVLRRTGGKKEKAAQILGINRRTLLRWEKGSVHDEPEEDSTSQDPISE
jgi:DNA-binding NtrC family response regulator